MVLVTDEEAWKTMCDTKIYTCKDCKRKLYGIMAVYHHVDKKGHHSFRVEGSELILCVG